VVAAKEVITDFSMCRFQRKLSSGGFKIHISAKAELGRWLDDPLVV
jgi:hypothetical protein